MKRASTLGRLERLEFITARLQSGMPTKVGDIADEVGVSMRTLSRDIQILRDQGLPIEADAGRGGGIRLTSNWGVGRVNFNFAEAVDLLVSLAVAEQMKSPFFMAHLNSARSKLVASFPPSLKSKTRGLKARILISERASLGVLSDFNAPKQKTVEQIHQAFVMRNMLRLVYQDINGATTKRTIEPHYLLLSMPVWYIIAFDHLRNDARTLRCDRITDLRIVDTEFKVQPISRFDSALEGIDAI